MKSQNLLLCLLLAAAVATPQPSVRAQTATSAVPGFISYQGRVLDAAGNPVGAGTPVNRTVIFRIWDHPSNTLAPNLIYAEQQTVTISDGDFSVLVGQGVAVSGTTQFGYSETAKKLADLGQAFTGASRFLGVTVDDGTATADNEITPRQQIVSAGFALRAKHAESLGTATGGTSLSVLDNGNTGIGTLTPSARLTITGSNTGTAGTPQLLVTDSADPSERLRIGVDNTGNGTGFIQSFKEGTGAQNLLLNPLGGGVGIGRTPGSGLALDVQGNVAATGSVTAASFTGSGAGLTSLPATSLTGTINDARLSGNVAMRNANNVFAGASNVFNNSVGIGTTASYPLHVNSAGFVASIIQSASPAGTWLGVQNTSPGGLAWHLISTGSGNGEGPGKLMIGFGTGPGANGNSPLTLTTTNVGIGTTAPLDAKLEVVGGVSTTGLAGAFINGNNVGSRVTHGTHDISIKTSGSINCGNTVIATSDERVKNIEGRSSTEADLRTLLGIEITDFRYKDKISKGEAPQKKVIAQQVEKVFPQAISRHTDVIPDIYRSAVVKEGWIQLATDLKKGETIRLIDEKDAESLHEVTQTEKERFRVAGLRVDAGRKVFVYGRQVKDFRSVDYDAIAMLNVSATQQIKKNLDAESQRLRDENEALRKRVAELEAKDEAITERLASIEKQLNGGTRPAGTKVASRSR